MTLCQVSSDFNATREEPVELFVYKYNKPNQLIKFKVLHCKFFKLMNGKFFNICRGGYINIRIINASVLTMINGKRVASGQRRWCGNCKQCNLVLFIYMRSSFNSLNTLQYLKMMLAVKPLLPKKICRFFFSYKLEFYTYVIFFVISMKKISAWLKITVYLFYWFRHND